MCLKVLWTEIPSQFVRHDQLSRNVTKEKTKMQVGKVFQSGTVTRYGTHERNDVEEKVM